MADTEEKSKSWIERKEDESDSGGGGSGFVDDGDCEEQSRVFAKKLRDESGSSGGGSFSMQKTPDADKPKEVTRVKLTAKDLATEGPIWGRS